MTRRKLGIKSNKYCYNIILYKYQTITFLEGSTLWNIKEELVQLFYNWRIRIIEARSINQKYTY